MIFLPVGPVVVEQSRVALDEGTCCSLLGAPVLLFSIPDGFVNTILIPLSENYAAVEPLGVREDVMFQTPISPSPTTRSPLEERSATSAVGIDPKTYPDRIRLFRPFGPDNRKTTALIATT